MDSGVSPETKEVPTEVERKFLIDSAKIPYDLLEISGASRLTQYYLRIDADGSEERVRKSMDLLGSGETTYEHTTKTDGTLTRGEVNELIDEKRFMALLDGDTVGTAIHKDRVTIPLSDGLIIELDIYKDAHDGLVVAEVEFHAASSQAAIDASHAFEIPEWFGPEVTADKRYKNKNLALYGVPSIGN